MSSPTLPTRCALQQRNILSQKCVIARCVVMDEMTLTTSRLVNGCHAYLVSLSLNDEGTGWKVGQKQKFEEVAGAGGDGIEHVQIRT